MSHNILKAVMALQEGKVIAVPTDTLYGLAADASSSAGIQHIYSIKQRQAQAPLAICIAEIDHLQRYCVTDHLTQQLLEQLLPGKVTLILQRRAEAPLCAELNPGLSSIGVLPETCLIFVSAMPMHATIQQCSTTRVHTTTVLHLQCTLWKWALGPVSLMDAGMLILRLQQQLAVLSLGAMPEASMALPTAVSLVKP